MNEKKYNSFVMFNGMLIDEEVAMRLASLLGQAQQTKAKMITDNINAMHKKRGDEMHDIYPDTIENGKEGKGQ